MAGNSLNLTALFGSQVANQMVPHQLQINRPSDLRAAPTGSLSLPSGLGLNNADPNALGNPVSFNVPIHLQQNTPGLSNPLPAVAPAPVSIHDLIAQSAKKWGVNPQLVYATMMTESSGHPNAYRAEPSIGDASYGLGQLLSGTARGLGYHGAPQGLYDPATNLDLTAHYIKNAIQAGAQNPQDVATYYNTGHLVGTPYPGHIQRFMSNYGGYQ